MYRKLSDPFIVSRDGDPMRKGRSRCITSRIVSNFTGWLLPGILQMKGTRKAQIVFICILEGPNKCSRSHICSSLSSLIPKFCVTRPTVVLPTTEQQKPESIIAEQMSSVFSKLIYVYSRRMFDDEDFVPHLAQEFCPPRLWLKLATVGLTDCSEDGWCS